MVSNGSRIMKKWVADSARKLLDYKQFMKDYEVHEGLQAVYEGFLLPIGCYYVMLSFFLSAYIDDSWLITPPELIALPLNATVSKLKSEAIIVFQEVYVMYKKFQAKKFLGFWISQWFFNLKVTAWNNWTSRSVRIEVCFYSFLV